MKRSKENRRLGPLEEGEIEKQVKFWIKRAQRTAEGTENLDRADRMQLNLQLNSEGLLECRGRIQGQYPIYLPDCHTLTEKIVNEGHLRTLHGGTGATMTQVRERYWVPRQRRLARDRTRDAVDGSELKPLQPHRQASYPLISPKVPKHSKLWESTLPGRSSIESRRNKREKPT